MRDDGRDIMFKGYVFFFFRNKRLRFFVRWRLVVYES